MERSELLEVVQFGALAMDGNEDKLVAKIAALEGCIAVYAQAVGASAVGQLKNRGIQPVKVTPGASVAELIESLQEQLREGPSAWLARAIEGQKPIDPTRFQAMEAEGWEE
jgi:nitrogen fixation protein NifX